MPTDMPSLPQLFHAAQWRRPWRLLLCLLFLIVSYAALSPGSQAPSLGVSDKLDHLLAFAALGVAFVLSMKAGALRSAAATVGLLGYGVLIEILQTQVPGRHADAMDVAVDAIGIAAGLAIAAASRRRWPAEPDGRAD